MLPIRCASTLAFSVGCLHKIYTKHTFLELKKLFGIQFYRISTKQFC